MQCGAPARSGGTFAQQGICSHHNSHKKKYNRNRRNQARSRGKPRRKEGRPKTKVNDAEVSLTVVSLSPSPWLMVTEILSDARSLRDASVLMNCAAWVCCICEGDTLKQGLGVSGLQWPSSSHKKFSGARSSAFTSSNTLEPADA